VKRLIVNIQFWIWAATHSPYFDEFQIIITPPIRVSLESVGRSLLYIGVSFNRVRVYISLSTTATEEFAKIRGDKFDTHVLFGDIPF
jgi:hypothetical protein